MPDGLTHVMVGYISVNRQFQKGWLTLFLFGSLLPDLLLRGGRLFFTGHLQRDFFELYLVPLHTPFTSLFICLALSQLFHSSIRKKSFIILYSGCLLHFFLDFFQCTIDGFGLKVQSLGGYHWLFPISWFDLQFGIFWPEDAPYSLIILTPIAIWVYIKNKKGGAIGMDN